MSEFVPGLVSVTFRKLSPREVIDLVTKAGLKAIEWGGDIHVPCGDLAQAGEVSRQMRDAGLSVAAYGSYYRLGASEAKGMTFESVLDTAATLGAPTIRVWAGEKGSAETTPEERSAIVADAQRIGELAKARGITASFEYHANTLTDTRESVQALMKEIPHPNIEFLWQPTYVGTEIEESSTRLQEVLPRVRHVHVFYWAAINDWRPLAEGEAAWARYFDIIRGTGKSMPCLLEFVRDHSPEQFLADAATLRRWLEK